MKKYIPQLVQAFSNHECTRDESCATRLGNVITEMWSKNLTSDDALKFIEDTEKSYHFPVANRFFSRWYKYCETGAVTIGHMKNFTYMLKLQKNVVLNEIADPINKDLSIDSSG